MELKTYAKSYDLHLAEGYAKAYTVCEIDGHDGWLKSAWSTKAEAISAAKKFPHAEVDIYRWNTETEEYESDCVKTTCLVFAK